jgi:hypothetical protein
MLLKVCV